VPETKQSPNILFFFPDQQRYDWMSGYEGVPVRMPHLDAVAARGVRFERCLCASPLCAPSRACLASGMEYERCGVPGNDVDYPLDQTTFYTRLRDAGYHVMGCGKFDLHKASPIWGLEGTHLLDEWGFSDGIDNAGKWDAYSSGREEPKDPYMAYLQATGLLETHVNDFTERRGGRNYSNTEPTLLPEHAYCDNWIGENGLKLIRRAPAERPWFLQVNFAGPHSPIDITKRMDAICRGRRFKAPVGSTQHTPEIHNACRQNYSAMCENIDRWLGAFLDELEARGELENTIIVYSSDHGEMLGDHDLWAKKYPHQPSIGVPLVMAGPDVARGVRSNALVSLIDLTATFLDYGGAAVPDGMDGRTLRPVLQGRTDAHRSHVYSGLEEWCIVMDERFKLVVHGDKNEAVQLFDVIDDPDDTTDLARETPEHVARLQALLEANAEPRA
jgi:arylsulfatase A-like enzyme